MAQSRPKVRVVRDPETSPREIEAAVGDAFDIEFVDPPAGGISGDAARLLEAIPDAAALIDANARPVWANPAFLLLDPALRRQIEARAAEHLHSSSNEGGTSAADELKDSSGRLLRLSISPSILPVDVESEAPAVAVLVHDVSDDRRRRERIEAIDRAGCDLLRLDSEAVQRLAPLERLDLLRSRIVRALQELFQFDHFAIRLLDQRTGRLEVIMSEGLPQMVSELEIHPALTGQGITGHVAVTGESYVCKDTRADPLFLPGLEEARSSLTVPLRLGDRIIGVLDVESDEAAAFDEEDRLFAEMFTRYVTLSIHMLELLVVERSTTNQNLSGRVEGEIRDPLEDIALEAQRLSEAALKDPETARHVQRIVEDVEDIRRRVKEVAAGPRSILGVDRAFLERGPDPALIDKRILIADDEAGIRRIIHDVLQTRGCDVEVRETGGQAIDAINQAMADERGFDLILSDIQMPDRNGYEVFSAVRDSMPGTPVILMTGFGYDPNHSIVRASQEGLQSVLFKPFQVERLLEEVRKALERSDDPQ